MSELPKGMSLKKFNDLPTTRAIHEEGENKIEYKVGQSVSVYASKEGRKGVDPNDLCIFGSRFVGIGGQTLKSQFLKRLLSQTPDYCAWDAKNCWSQICPSGQKPKY
ncbi:uncharacterized protein F5147DRAFT_655038 [Suillus discolor]|uniref:Uncharacterized protein n=1 Tax=Suillus discolor TaxID=1912936 RepID=A0A9P7F3D6_9AGAM|nr:uncharacterized protein F5147DRAFT_655038 [Suillus discolor]KAG2102581.1 hypothetical protein F5147DRAFT_655038 [Suillus discolor]